MKGQEIFRVITAAAFINSACTTEGTVKPSGNLEQVPLVYTANISLNLSSTNFVLTPRRDGTKSGTGYILPYPDENRGLLGRYSESLIVPKIIITKDPNNGREVAVFPCNAVDFPSKQIPLEKTCSTPTENLDISQGRAF